MKTGEFQFTNDPHYPVLLMWADKEVQNMQYFDTVSGFLNFCKDNNIKPIKK